MSVFVALVGVGKDEQVHPEKKITFEPDGEQVGKRR